MKLRYIYSIAVLLIALISCREKLPIDENKIENEIKGVLIQQASEWNEGDLEGYMFGYIKSDSLRFASGGTVSFGWDTTLARYKRGYPDKSIMGHLTFSRIDVNIISDNAALAFGQWELVRENDKPWGLFTLLFRKTDLGWRIVHDHTSSSTN